VALKDGAGSDPTGPSPCKISFRNATITTGTFTQVSTSAATSVVASSGSTLGCTSAVACVIYVYAINNAGTVELGLIDGILIDEGTVYSSTTEGGAGAADAFGTLYSSTGRTSKAVRLLGRITITEGTAGTWASNSSEISNVPLKSPGSKVARINAIMAGAGSITTLAEGPSGLTVTNNATGDNTLNVPSGYFTANPTCICVVFNAGAQRICNLKSISTTAIQTKTTNVDGTTAGAEAYHLSCTGAAL
jgi:hypothetical protein